MSAPLLHRFTAVGPAAALAEAEAHALAHDPPLALSTSLFEHDGPHTARLELLFDHLPDHDAVLHALGLAGANITTALSTLGDQDWVALSQAALPPVEAGRFRVRGSHDAPRAGGTVDLLIDAAEAFGTGHHATTAGCLEALSDGLKRSRPSRILDVGCGSGVLAIAVAKATHRPALATDIDPIAVRVTRCNTRINGVNGLVRAVTANGLDHPLLRNTRFDLIFANILAGPLIAMASDVTAALAPGGRIILSGLLAQQMRAVEAAYRARGAALERRLIRDGWATLVMRRH